MSDLQEQLHAAFCGGFKAAQEGYNGEWLLGNNPTDETIQRETEKDFQYWIDTEGENLI